MTPTEPAERRAAQAGRPIAHAPLATLKFDSRKSKVASHRHLSHGDRGPRLCLGRRRQCPALVLSIPHGHALFLPQHPALAGGRAGPVAIGFSTAAGINIGLNLVLVPWLGINGSALATLCSFFCLAGILGLYTGGQRRLSELVMSIQPRRLALTVILSTVTLGSWYIPEHRFWGALRVLAAALALFGGIRSLRAAQGVTDRADVLSSPDLKESNPC